MQETSTSERVTQDTAGPAPSSSKVNTVNPGESTSASALIDKALPLHVNLTHSPPKLHEDDESEIVSDPGHIGTLTLVPCTFSDGSSGWKGRRKVNVELLNIQPGESASVVDVDLFVSAKVVNDKIAAAPASKHVGEVDGGAGGAGGYESDNDDPLV